ncbi:MAG: hypothetical protein HC903_05605 [Methylacidiphilales bacterium]|nr:hypothetical protein [Candidatus Methylacidiphilales bacterium]NJR19294.1 hypothetical protein [Calothrix sp. CSU_2_0]
MWCDKRNLMPPAYRTQGLFCDRNNQTLLNETMRSQLAPSDRCPSGLTTCPNPPIIILIIILMVLQNMNGLQIYNFTESYITIKIFRYQKKYFKDT